MGATEQGAICTLVIQEELEYKVDPVIPDAQKIYLSSESISFSRPNEESDVMRGGDRNPTKPARGLDDVSGDINTELQAYLGRVYKGVFGSVTSVFAAGIGTHTFKIGTSLPSFMVERHYPTLGKYFKYSGIKFGKLSGDLTAKGFQKLSISASGATETRGNAPFDATPLDLGKISFDGRAIGLIEEGGEAIGTITKITGLTIENGLDLGEDNYVLGGDGSRTDIPAGTVKVSGTLFYQFRDLDLYEKAINGTESSLHYKYQLGDGSGSAGNESLEVKLSELLYSPKTSAISGPKGLLGESPFVAYYDKSPDASALVWILKNTQPTI